MSFDYTKKSWDKARPTLLKSTGLGDALAKYQVAKANTKGAPVDYIVAVKKCFDAAEKCREEAIKLCKAGKYKDAEKYLESANPKEETGLFAIVFANKVINLLAEVKPVVLTFEERTVNRVDIMTKGAKQILEYKKWLNTVPCGT